MQEEEENDEWKLANRSNNCTKAVLVFTTSNYRTNFSNFDYSFSIDWVVFFHLSSCFYVNLLITFMWQGPNITCVYEVVSQKNGHFLSSLSLTKELYFTKNISNYHYNVGFDGFKYLRCMRRVHTGFILAQYMSCFSW